MVLQKLYAYREKIDLLRGSLLKILLSDTRVSIGRSFKVSEFPKLTLLKEYDLKIGENVIIGKSVDLRVYDGSSLIIEDNCKIDDGVRIIAANGSKVHIKRNSKIGFYSVLNGGGSISIGPDSSTYGFVYLQSSAHLQKVDSGFSRSDYEHAEIDVGSSVLIGPHSVVMPGGTIKDNSSIEAHSVIVAETIQQ